MKNALLRSFAVAGLSTLAMVAAGHAVFAAVEEGLERHFKVLGGLVVQIGGDDPGLAVALSKTGRFLVNVVEAEAATVDTARKEIRARGHYGLASVEPLAASGKLRYAENVVNVVIASEPGVSLAEIHRVLTPGGVVMVTNADVADAKALHEAEFASVGEIALEDGGHALRGTKPWPDDIDTWSHPRHAADGNAVSTDTQVGPPDRVRWIAGATKEVEGLVTAGGRNFYGGVLARDSFNGLRLWHHDLAKAEHNTNDFVLPRLSRDGPRPVASDRFLFAVVKNELVGLDAASGEIVVTYPGMTMIRDVLHVGETVIAAGETAVRAYDAASGDLLWEVAAGEPRNLIAGGDLVSFIHGRVKRGEDAEAVTLDRLTGKERWRRSDYPWLNQVTRTVLHDRQIAFEVSTFNDHDLGNGIHVVSAETGVPDWEKLFPPGMNHKRQARAMFLDDGLWILHGGKTNTVDKDNMERLPIEVSSLDPATGETMTTYDAGLAHCFPPVATPNFVFAGVLDMTDLNSGEVIANRITKANCSQENGWVPANGLVYTTPKHCTCWPMLRGYVSMAARGREPAVVRKPVEEIEFPIERGTAQADPGASEPAPSDWPLYRNDRWRSGSTTHAGPKTLATRWTTKLVPDAEVEATRVNPVGPIPHDWRENPYVKGPLSAPTVANGLVYVTRPDAHEVIAMDAETGDVRWRFTADGRVDTPPAIYRGVCLFGSLGGSVFALRADTGELIWRRQAGPTEERIVAYGQVESPWPVSGAVLVMDDIAYYVAGRQAFADGGVLMFAVDPMTGDQRWVRRIEEVPQKGYYENSGLEFDAIDILHAEGDTIAMSRWIFSRDGKDVSVDKWDGFARIDTGGGAAFVHRGSWTYGARHVHRFPGEARRRPLAAVRDGTVYSSLNGTNTLFRRDFNLEGGEDFGRQWITGWEASKTARDGGTPYRTYRLAEEAAWKRDHFTPEVERGVKKKIGTQLYNDLHAMALAGNDRLFVVHKDGRMTAVSTTDGSVLAEALVPQPAWDGLAIAGGRLFLATQSGEVFCLGE